MFMADPRPAPTPRFRAPLVAQLFLAGIGPDGHIAFNEPGSSLSSRTRIKTLAQETVVANARFFGGDLSAVPRMALTVGVATVLDADEVLVIITGTHKAYALAKCIEEGVNHMFTVSAIQMHPKGIVVCDEDATLELRVRTAKCVQPGGSAESARTAWRKRAVAPRAQRHATWRDACVGTAGTLSRCRTARRCSA